MKEIRQKWLFLWLVVFAVSNSQAQQNFRQIVGNTPVGQVAQSTKIQVPYITWGGDVATFLANGDLQTKGSSIFGMEGLDIQLTPGDDFVAQVKDYMAGKSPMLRGTVRMLGQASEVIGSDPRTKPVVILQLSWSAGDHIVGREDIKTLNDLKGKRIACQQGGPHVGLLYDSLSAAQLTNSDVEIVWTKDLTGPNGAAEAFRKDATIAACCVITPDLIGLTGGFESAGSGAEGTVAGAHVVNSTQQMSRSIADVYAVRRDWYDANKNWVEKFVAGYLKASKQLVALRNDFEQNQRMSDQYKTILATSQRILGAEVLPTLEVDAHGLLLDCNFMGLPGQQSFFLDKGNLSGFTGKLSEALDMATGWGYARARIGFDANDLNYQSIAKLAGLEFTALATNVERFNTKGESATTFFGDNLDSNTIVSFTISFEPNQYDFSTDQYGGEFQRALKAASTFGNARVVIRGHADPTKTLQDLVRTGVTKGLIQQTGNRNNYRYFYKGKPLDLENLSEVMALVQTGAFAGGEFDPHVTMQAALNLSKLRADNVKQALADFGKQISANVDLSQIVPVGVGIAEPVISKPQSIEQAKENMRVEFRIVKVDAETLEFDF
ncbi:MAG: ABC transporter substrate-binding protein [Planctomycetales bacterium]|nr:ABC transporter substrate-binding protein [Planctomycetales bacterium]